MSGLAKPRGPSKQPRAAMNIAPFTPPRCQPIRVFLLRPSNRFALSRGALDRPRADGSSALLGRESMKSSWPMWILMICEMASRDDNEHDGRCESRDREHDFERNVLAWLRASKQPIQES